MYFIVNDKIAIGAEVYRTSRSWGHKAHLYRRTPSDQDDEHIQSAKVRYFNRTWERYEFESILHQLISKALGNRSITLEEAGVCNDFIEAYEPENPFKAVIMMAKMGDLLTTTQKDNNDWKARMLRAGLENKGLIMPEDWDSLSENEKENRLNGVIEILA